MKRRVRWNEANLSEIEANKRERKKIDEPKTPYPPPMIEEDGSPSAESIDYAAHAEALKNALKKLALSGKHNSPFGGWTSSDDEEGETGRDEDQGLAKQRDASRFEERRRAHYDEFKKAKELQGKACFLDDDDQHDNGIHISCSCSTLSNDSIDIDIEDGDEILLIIEIEENDDLSYPQWPHLINLIN